jgi:hypothetical protein
MTTSDTTKRGLPSAVNLVLVCMLSVAVLCGAATESDFDFRRVNWGMTPDEVLKAEATAPDVRDHKRLQFKTRILDREVMLSYFFAEEKLVAAEYQLYEVYLRTESYRKTYNAFKTALTTKYGNPTKEGLVWIDDLYRNDAAKMDLALSSGHAQYISIWDNATVRIKCSLRGSHHNIFCTIEYTSKAHMDLVKPGKPTPVIDPI